jgi:hypothetical protein
MALRVRITPIRRDLDVMFNQGIGPKAQSALLAAFAEEKIEEAKAQNKQVLGAVPPYDVYVDGREGAPLESVKPDGTIRAEFQLVNEALAWISTQLQLHSPVLTGRYAKSHELFADGVDTENPNAAPPAEEYVFINIQPYARKIEGYRGLGGVVHRGPSSPQAPDGVYQAVATLAQRRFGNVAKITFSYRTAIGGAIIGGKAGDRASERNPAIIVRLR